MRTILFFLLPILFFVIVLALLLALGMGVGWVLTRIAPFTLFEGTLLGLIGLFGSTVLLARVMRTIAATRPRGDDFMDEEDVEEYDSIPASRFAKATAEQTWENWCRYTLANEIYRGFQDDVQGVQNMNDLQVQELCVRLGDVALAILKTKPATTNRLQITAAQLRQQLVKMGQKPYEDDILNTAEASLADYLASNEDNLLVIMRRKRWAEPGGYWDEVTD